MVVFRQAPSDGVHGREVWTLTNHDLEAPAPGDVNGDGVVNNVDATLLFQYSLGTIPSLPHPEAADVWADGVINNQDALILFGWVLENIAEIPVTPGGGAQLSMANDQ